MATLKNKQKTNCSSCLKIIGKTQKSIECLTCGKHALSCCDTITGNTLDTCQKCLTNILPFQTLDDLEYQFTVLNGNNVSEKDMDRLNNLKFNPYDVSSDI